MKDPVAQTGLDGVPDVGPCELCLLEKPRDRSDAKNKERKTVEKARKPTGCCGRQNPGAVMENLMVPRLQWQPGDCQKKTSRLPTWYSDLQPRVLGVFGRRGL